MTNPAPNTKPVTLELQDPSGTGTGIFQLGTALLDPATQKPKCYRLGGIPYAKPLTSPTSQRWKRPQPLSAADYRRYLHHGTRENPADFSGLAAECPQPGPARDMGANDKGDGAGSGDVRREDCFQLNIWIPAGEPPEKKRGSGGRGWPVFFYIHGGFLQWGSPNKLDPSALLSESPIRCIIVAPSYRLNVFGFLACRELLAESKSASGGADKASVGNLGFWDQRLALEWTAANIGHYGGNADNITVGGLSAGAYSTFHQLAYETLMLPSSSPFSDKPLKGIHDNPSSRGSQIHIRRIIMWSNGCGLQPKPLAELQPHFHALLRILEIPLSLPRDLLFARLRLLPPQKLLHALSLLPENSFRAVSDGTFISPHLLASLRSGEFATILARRGVRVLIGEVCDERNSYRSVSPPPEEKPGGGGGGFAALVRRLAVEYPVEASQRLARMYCSPSGGLPSSAGEASLAGDGERFQSWKELWGKLYADMQVHVSGRGLVESLCNNKNKNENVTGIERAFLVPGRDVLRYRIEWRPACVAEMGYPARVGVAHGSDLSIWFWGNGTSTGLSEVEKGAVGRFLEPLQGFLEGRGEGKEKEEEEGKNVGPWGTQVGSMQEMRVLGPEGGEWQVKRDRDWERAMWVWKGVLGEGVEGRQGERESKL